MSVPPNITDKLRALAERGFILVRFYGDNCPECFTQSSAEMYSITSILDAEQDETADPLNAFIAHCRARAGEFVAPGCMASAERASWLATAAKAAAFSESLPAAPAPVPDDEAVVREVGAYGRAREEISNLRTRLAEQGQMFARACRDRDHYADALAEAVQAVRDEYENCDNEALRRNARHQQIVQEAVRAHGERIAEAIEALPCPGSPPDPLAKYAFETGKERAARIARDLTREAVSE